MCWFTPQTATMARAGPVPEPGGRDPQVSHVCAGAPGPELSAACAGQKQVAGSEAESQPEKVLKGMLASTRGVSAY